MQVKIFLKNQLHECFMMKEMQLLDIKNAHNVFRWETLNLKFKKELHVITWYIGQ